MKYFKQFVLPVFIIIVSIFLMQIFRVMPASRLWNGYTVMYLPVSQDSKIIEKTLEEYGCNDYISLRNQKVPLNVSEFSPEYMFGNGDANGYLEKRKGYFFDFSRSYSVYYIPDSSDNCIPAVLKKLNSMNISAGINSSSACPWMSILVVFVFAILQVWFSPRRIFTAMLNFFPVFFTFKMPFYSVASACCIFMTAMFICLRYWNRDGAVRKLQSSMPVIMFVFSPVLIVFLTGLKVGFLFLLVPIDVLAIAYVYFEVCLIFESRYSFRPVLIRPASMINLMTNTNRFVVISCLAGTFLIFVSAVLSLKNVSIMETSAGSGILLPSKNSSGRELPGLEDFNSWRWSALTFPYRSLNEMQVSKTQKGQTVVFPRYTEKNGKIEKSVNSITYDDSFRKDSFNSIDDFSYNSIESMLKKQGYTGRAGYSGAGSSGVSVFMCILLVMAMLIPGIFCIRNYKKNKWRETRQ